MIRLALLALLLINTPAHARGVYLTHDQFVSQSFNSGQSPSSETLWLTAPIREQATAILGHPPQGLRVRYHREGTRTAWILDEIGKELPITIGLLIDHGKIEKLSILAFRESRGGEVRYSAYTRQYRGITLDDNYRLSGNIDGITGATLSVRAVNRVAALALYYHRLVVAKPTQEE